MARLCRRRRVRGDGLLWRAAGQDGEWERWPAEPRRNVTAVLATDRGIWLGTRHGLMRWTSVDARP